MIDYKAILKQRPVGVFATQDGNTVKTRVFQYFDFDESENKVYFATSNKKPVYAQIQRNSNVSFCTYTENYDPVLSVNGKAIFVNDPVLKERAFEADPSMADIYQTPKNPEFEVFYLTVEEIEAFSFEAGPIKFKV
jgi:uncharacterized pyridoxamine 5'-phosphate oxidase family protein